MSLFLFSVPLEEGLQGPIDCFFIDLHIVSVNWPLPLVIVIISDVFYMQIHVFANVLVFLHLIFCQYFPSKTNSEQYQPAKIKPFCMY